jgi:hypothetical protein
VVGLSALQLAVGSGAGGSLGPVGRPSSENRASAGGIPLSSGCLTVRGSTILAGYRQ